MWLKAVPVITMFVLVMCGKDKEEEKRIRRPKLLTFNTVDEKIEVNLEFSIPFITISAKKAVDAAFGFWPADLPTININPGSLAVGSAVVLATTVLIPVLSKTFLGYGTDHGAGHGHYNYHHHHHGRLLDSAEFSTDAVLDFASHALSDSQFVRGCAFRISCWTGQKASSESTQVWNNIMSNNIFSAIINSTALQDAMLSGRNGRDCTTYTPCPILEEHLPFLAKKGDVERQAHEKSIPT